MRLGGWLGAFLSLVAIGSCNATGQNQPSPIPGAGGEATDTGGSVATGGEASMGGEASTGGSTAASGGGDRATGGGVATGGAPATGGRTGGRRATGGQSASGGTPTGGQSATGGAPAGGIPATGGRSTEFCKTGVERARIGQSPGTSFYIGAWTHAVEPMGSAKVGNDYPFIVECSDTVNSKRQTLLMISGNIGYDPGPKFWYYNQNITTATGDYNTILAHAGQYGYPTDFPDEAGVRGWVYVGWHYRPSSSGTLVSQYLKFGTAGPVILVEDTIDGTGGWTNPKPAPFNETVTPTAINVGGGSQGCDDLYLQYAKVYAMATPPSKAEVDAIALRITPDPDAWADWPLLSGDLRDVSGHDRALTASVDRNGTPAVFPAAIAGPAF